MTAPLLPDGLPGPVRTSHVPGTPRRDGTAIDLATVSVGAPDAPAVVLAHGVGSSARFVTAAFAGPVVAAGWRLVTYDLRGHGSSTTCPDPADHHLDVHVGDLGAVVAATPGRLRAVGGISLGGHAALRWARTAADDDAALLACLPAWLGPATPGDGPHAVIAAEVRRTGVAAILTRLRRDDTLLPWLRDTLVTDYARHEPASLAAALIALDGGDAPTEAEVAAVDRPLAVVGWEDDPGHPWEVAQRLVAVAPRAVLRRLEMADLQDDLERFGRTAVGALRAVGPNDQHATRRPSPPGRGADRIRE